MENLLKPLSPYVHWGMRLSVTATYLWHGYHNLPPGGFERRFGMPGGYAMAILEMASGVALLAGGFTKPIVTRLGAAGVLFFMVGAIVLVHGPMGWDSRTGGAEFQVLLFMVGLYFFVKGNDDA
jgi:putative oxidoreductase